MKKELINLCEIMKHGTQTQKKLMQLARDTGRMGKIFGCYHREVRQFNAGNIFETIVTNEKVLNTGLHEMSHGDFNGVELKFITSKTGASIQLKGTTCKFVVIAVYDMRKEKNYFGNEIIYIQMNYVDYESIAVNGKVSLQAIEKNGKYTRCEWMENHINGLIEKENNHYKSFTNEIWNDRD